MRISDWSSDVCSSDLNVVDSAAGGCLQPVYGVGGETALVERQETAINGYRGMGPVRVGNQAYEQIQHDAYGQIVLSNTQAFFDQRLYRMAGVEDFRSLERVGEHAWAIHDKRSEEHTSELQSLMRISYAVFCLKKK